MPSDNDPTKLSFCRVRKSDRERFKPTISHSVFPSDSTAMIAPFVISQRDLSPKLTTCQNKRKDCTLIWSFFFKSPFCFVVGTKGNKSVSCAQLLFLWKFKLATQG